MSERPVAPVRRLLHYAKPYRKRYLQASAYSVINKLFDIAPEVLIGVAIDVVVQRQQSFLARLGLEDTIHQLAALALLTFFIWLFESIFEYLYSIGWRGLAQSIQHDLRTDTYRHVQALDVAFFENQNSGNLVAIMNDDINQLERFLDGGANDLIQVATTVVAVGAIFFYLAPAVAIWSMLPIPVIIAGAFIYERKSQPLYADVRAKAGRLSARLTNNLSGLLTIKAQTTEETELATIERESRDYLNANAQAIRVSSAFIPLIRMAILAGFLATLVVGGMRSLDGSISVGVYGVLVFLTQRLLWPLTGLARTIDLYQRAMASTRRILDLLASPMVAPSGHLKDVEAHFDGPIAFSDVGFAYATRQSTLDRISLTIEPNTTVALVGATGSGKSTVAKLLLRFYEPQSGLITVGGVPLQDFDVTALRQQIGFVGQDSFLIDGTVRENINYGLGELHSDRTEEAARLAEAMEFIDHLPLGLDTPIGEQGQKLSGGQRQRIAIARAIIKSPALLVMDEATSAVDNETERLIQKSLRKLAHGRTLLIIAHRLSTVRHADKIYVMEGGRIAEAGSHDELLSLGGIYRRLWDIQTGAIADEA